MANIKNPYGILSEIVGRSGICGVEGTSSLITTVVVTLLITLIE